MSSTKTDLAKLSREEEKLLNTLVDKGRRETKPQRLGDVIVYQGLEELSKETGDKEVKKLLKTLTSKGFMKEKDHDSALFCPRCGSINVLSRYNCPHCQSFNVLKIQLLEHPFCGYIGNRREFDTEKGLVCPKCKTFIGDFFEAQSREQKDKPKIIKVIGSSFVCEKCDGKFEKPLVVHSCEKCGANFTYREAIYEKLPSYALTEKVEELAPNRFETDSLRHIEKILIERGYHVELGAKLVGKSGVEQSFDIVARKGNDVILLDASTWGNQNDLISLLGKKMDVDSKSVILLDLAGNPNLASLGKPYSITVLDGRDEKYRETLIGLLEGAGKADDDKRRSPLRWRRS